VEQLQRDHQEQQPTGHLERLEGDPEEREHLLSAQGEGEDDDARHARGQQGGATPLGHVLTTTTDSVRPRAEFRTGCYDAVQVPDRFIPPIPSAS